jgi:hypothetical protein
MRPVVMMPDEQYWGALEHAIDNLSKDVWSALQALEAERELLVRVDEMLTEVLVVEGQHY